MQQVKIKVCGMKDLDNITQLATLPIDYMGFIFYRKSARYVAQLPATTLDILPKRIKKVGVFVNETVNTVLHLSEQYGLDCLQLHGGENIDYCTQLRTKLPTIELIKVFNVAQVTDMKQTKDFESLCDCFLFDTRTVQHGGSGTKFDWQILDAYRGVKPFFLSGGIGPGDIPQIKALQHPQFAAVDVNSCFEKEPGLKDIERLSIFVKELKQ